MYAVSESQQDRSDGISRLLAYSLPSYLRRSDDTDQKCRNSTFYAYINKYSFNSTPEHSSSKQPT